MGSGGQYPIWFNSMFEFCQKNDLFNIGFSIAFPNIKELAGQCKAQEKYKERLDLGVTWLKWLPTGMESKTRLAPKSNKVNSQKLTLNWNTSLCYRVVWKWRQSDFYEIIMQSVVVPMESSFICVWTLGLNSQLLTINFVWFGCHPGFRFHTSRQSFEPNYTQIQALLVFFLSIALSKKERINKSS